MLYDFKLIFGISVFGISVFKLKSSYLLIVFFCNWPKKGFILDPRVIYQCTLCLTCQKEQENE